MITSIKSLPLFALAAALSVTTALSGPANAGADQQASPVQLLTAHFAPRNVVQVEAGDFHFRPGQVAPLHTHAAPAIGYVAKGSIIYQVEGERPQILREGDAFFEPTDLRILRFDNASASEEAIFIDFNLQQAGEPFILFEEELKEDIDRRTLPTVALDGATIEQAHIFASELAPGGSLTLQNSEPTLGIVAEGVVELQLKGEAVQRLLAGQTFALPNADSQAEIVNASTEVGANIITFRLR